MNRLTKILFCNSLAAITSTLIINVLGFESAQAQQQPSCFMVNSSGEVINLANICNVKPQLSINSINRATQNNNSLNNAFIPSRTEIPNRPVERVYFVGNGNVPFTLGTSSTTYYSGDRSAYVRRYSESQRFSNRDDARNALLRIGVDTGRTNFSGRTPFIIYRYQK